MAYVAGSHHVALSVGRAQEDVDFHVKVLGMRFIKRTVLFDGSLPYKPRPWIEARMPAFAGYAERLSAGLAAQHGYPPASPNEA